jgi:TrmH family RNA methyltransferase
MLSKAQIKHIRSLGAQKYRQEHQQFIAEGDKIVREWLQSAQSVSVIVSLEDWAATNMALISRHPEATLHIVPEHVLESVSQLQTPNGVLIVCPIPSIPPQPLTTWTLALDDIQDPGNMGTIIRIADWFGIPRIIHAPGCVDIYNPKVIQSAMGGHLRVSFQSHDLMEYLSAITLPIIAATLDGSNIYNLPRLPAAVLLIGNESKGVKPELQALATQRVTIPGKGGAESLNAAVSAGICCALLMPQ